MNKTESINAYEIYENTSKEKVSVTINVLLKIYRHSILKMHNKILKIKFIKAYNAGSTISDLFFFIKSTKMFCRSFYVYA